MNGLCILKNDRCCPVTSKVCAGSFWEPGCQLPGCIVASCPCSDQHTLSADQAVCLACQPCHACVRDARQPHPASLQAQLYPAYCQQHPAAGMTGRLGGQWLWRSLATPQGCPQLDFLGGPAAASVLVGRVTRQVALKGIFSRLFLPLVPAVACAAFPFPCNPYASVACHLSHMVAWDGDRERVLHRLTGWHMFLSLLVLQSLSSLQQRAWAA